MSARFNGTAEEFQAWKTVHSYMNRYNLQEAAAYLERQGCAPVYTFDADLAGSGLEPHGVRASRSAMESSEILILDEAELKAKIHEARNRGLITKTTYCSGF